MKSYINNQFDRNGSVIAITLLIMVALSLSSLMAMNIAVSDSIIMRNSRSYRTDLYRAETGLTLAGETHVESWLSPDSDLFDLSVDDAAVMVEDFSITGVDGDDMPAMGSYAIARIDGAPAAGSLSGKFYALGHQAPMPAGSGCSAKSFEIRRYGVLATGSSRPDKPDVGVTVEAGVYKVFNIF